MSRVTGRRALISGLTAISAGAAASLAAPKPAEASEQGQAAITGEINHSTVGATGFSRTPSGAGLNTLIAWPSDVNGTNGILGYSNGGTANGVTGATFPDSSTGSGVYGYGGPNAHSGVRGEGGGTTYTYGVYGHSTGLFGVYGAGGTAAGVRGSANLAAGVDGVQGIATSGDGVHGEATNGNGVYAYSNSGNGVLGYSGSGTGVVGYSGTSFGVVGQCFGNFPGVVGVSLNNAGVYGSSTNNNGVVGQTSGNGAGCAGFTKNGFGVFGGVQAGGLGYAGYFQGNVIVTGSHTVLGAKSAAVPHPDGSLRRMYSVEAPESWFEDFGDGRVDGGVGKITLDPEFAAVVRTDSYKVFLTPLGDTRGLYVRARGTTGFEVRETQGGTGTVAFTYRVVAKRNDIEGQRLEKVPDPSAATVTNGAPGTGGGVRPTPNSAGGGVGLGATNPPTVKRLEHVPALPPQVVPPPDQVEGGRRPGATIR